MTFPAPTRLVGRHLTAFMLRSAVARARLHGGDLVQSFAFSTIVSANLHASPIGSGDPVAVSLSPEADDATPRRPVSVNAVARSLGVPYETMRGRVALLVKAGLVEAVRGGVVAPAATLRRPDFQAAYFETYLAFQEMLERLCVAGFDLQASAERAWAPGPDSSSGPPPPALVARAAIAHQLRTVERITQVFGDLPRGFLWSAVLHANVHHVDQSPDLAWRYGAEDSPPPDTLRRPVSIRALSRDLNMPFETTRRHVNTLLAQGYLAAVEGGVRVPTAVLSDGPLSTGNVAMMSQFMRLIGLLHRIGFVFPADGEATGRPSADRAASLA